MVVCKTQLIQQRQCRSSSFHRIGHVTLLKPSGCVLAALTCPPGRLLDSGTVALGQTQAAAELEPCWDLTFEVLR